MKPLPAVLLLSALTSLQAAEGLPDAGPHHRRIQRVQAVTRADGTAGWITNSYVHLEPGLNRASRDGWVPADERLEVVGDSVVAQGTQHRAIFSANVLDGLQVEMPDSTDGATGSLTAYCLGLSFYDAASGQSVLIAEAQDVVAEVHPPNILVYRGALAGDGVEADLVFVNHRDRVEQLVVIQALGVSPEDYQLVSASTRLEVVTEFVDPPVPRKQAQVLRREEDPVRRRAMVEPDLVDESLDFGSMHMPAGQAFVPAGDLRQAEAAGAIPVAKRWQVLEAEGRTALFEAVEFESLRPLLSALKPNAGRAVAQAAQRRQPTLTRTLPARRFASNAPKPVQMAKAAGLPRGVAVDWTLVNSGTIANAVFAPGTFYVAGQVTLTATNATFSAPLVFKFSPTNNARLNLACSNVTWLASAGRPVVMTGRDDNSIGESITNGTLSGTYATTALNIQAPLTGVNLDYLRVVNAQTALAFGQGTGHTVSHAQFVNCGTPIKLTNAEVRVRNALMVNATTCFDFISSTGRVEHLTVNGATTLNNAGVLILTNSLIVAVGATNGWSGVSNAFVSNATGVFATAAAGSHYLASGSAYRDAGTSDISTNLLQDFKGMATVAPTFLTDTITTATTLGPQVERDTVRPDLGWHYVALDYIATLLTVSNATLTLTNGVAVGFYGAIWVWPRDATLISEGTPDRLNRLASLSASRNSHSRTTRSSQPRQPSTPPATRPARRPSVSQASTAPTTPSSGIQVDGSPLSM